MKTIIEFFDECQLENVIAVLRFKPEKVVFIGFNESMKENRIETLRRFFELRKLPVELEFRHVARYRFDLIVEKLEQILDENEDCCFDLTGGKELTLTAMGMVASHMSVPMFQFNVRTGRFIPVSNCDDLLPPDEECMTVHEIVVLNGGEIDYNDVNDYQWNLTNEFRKDIDLLWEICRKDCKRWNRQINVFGSFEKYVPMFGLTVEVDTDWLAGLRCDTLLDDYIIGSLIKHGLIHHYEYDCGRLKFTYKNEQIHQCLTKAGNVLELYTYLTAKDISDLNPGYFDDQDIGVVVDWDGIIHRKNENIIETRNEVDVIVMKDMIPVFISCKNGEVTKDALYELETVAEKFGGEYAKKILVCTYLNSNKDSASHIRQRANDMGIEIIYDVHRMSNEDFFNALKDRTR